MGETPQKVETFSAKMTQCLLMQLLCQYMDLLYSLMFQRGGSLQRVPSFVALIAKSTIVHLLCIPWFGYNDQKL